MASKHKLIQWFKAHQGFVTYSQVYRQGPNTYDSASAMFQALMYADFLPQGKRLGNLSLLAKLEGSLLKAIPAHQIRRGDIFISSPDETFGAIDHEGHTGVLIDHQRIILCCKEFEGIVITKKRTWPNESIQWYRLCQPVKRFGWMKDWIKHLCPTNKKGALQAIEIRLAKKSNKELI